MRGAWIPRVTIVGRIRYYPGTYLGNTPLGINTARYPLQNSETERSDLSQSFENVRLTIADPSPLVRSGLKSALYAMGFRAITDTASFVKLHDLIEQDAVDLLVTASEVESNHVGYLVNELRSQRLGTNPFVVVITLLASAEPDYVRRVIDSGGDDLLLTPVAPDQLITRIQKLARTRKPFVITHDYTGPDRRTKARAFDNHSAPMLEVPNPLKIRAEAIGLDGTRLERMVRESSVTLNRIKVERYAVQLDWLVQHINASIRDGMVADPQTLAPYTTKLQHVAEDMIRRMKGTPTEGQINGIAEVLEIAHKLESDPAKVGYGELERLAAQAKTTYRALGAPPASVATMVPAQKTA